MELGVAEDLSDQEADLVMVFLLLSTFHDGNRIGRSIRVPNLIDQVDRLFADASVCIGRVQNDRPEQARQGFHDSFAVY